VPESPTYSIVANQFIRAWISGWRRPKTEDRKKSAMMGNGTRPRVYCFSPDFCLLVVRALA
jgi:hypothetical protein